MNGFNRDQNVGRITPAPFHLANEKALTGIRIYLTDETSDVCFSLFLIGFDVSPHRFFVW